MKIAFAIAGFAFVTASHCRAQSSGGPPTSPMPSNGSTPAPELVLLPSAQTHFTPEQSAKIILLESCIPKIQLSDKLKQQGFTASYRFDEKQKQLEILSKAKDWAGIVNLCNGRPYADFNDIEKALRDLTKYNTFKIAIQSPNITCNGRQYLVNGIPKENGSWSVGIVELPAPARPFEVESNHQLRTNLKVTTSNDLDLYPHPADNGFLYQTHGGDHTCFIFLDWTARRQDEKSPYTPGPGGGIKSMKESFKSDLEKLNAQLKLGELSPEQLSTAGNARLKTFTDAVSPLVK